MACGGDRRGAPAFPQQVPNPFDVSARDSAPGAAAGAGTASRAAKPANRTYRGRYLRATDTSSFMPCGMTKYVPITGDGAARAELRERFRWYLASMGRPLLAVFRGHFQQDTVDAGTGDKASGPPTVVEHFYLVDVDSLRVWDGDECAPGRLPRD